MSEALEKRRATLDMLWRQGLSGRPLLQAHTRIIDDHLVEAFTRCAEAGEGMTLVALGGYGRRELFPFSDIDLLLLHEEGMEDRLNAVAKAVFYPLWDGGLEVGHSVRTPEASVRDGDDDFFFQVALLDARRLAGSESLYNRLITGFREHFVEGNRPAFLENMELQRAKRLERYGEHGYMLEPHIKESRGGLRDVQYMLWTAQVVFGLREPSAMEDAGLMSAGERLTFEKAWDQLIRIRNRLHYVSGRRNDQLFFEHQEEMAEAFGFKRTDGMLEVEHFMREVHEHMQNVAVITDLFFEHVDEIARDPGRRQEQDEAVLEANIAARRGRIHLLQADRLKGSPHQLMRVFVQSAKTGLPVHYRTRKVIKEHLGHITERSRSSRRMARSFLDILLAPGDHAESTLEAMLETGLLTAFLPEFEFVQSLAQHDIYHVFTVDRHLLRTVGELNRLGERNGKVFGRIRKRHVLYLAALLHDIGKGKGGNHGEIGARIAAGIGLRLGFDKEDNADLEFLVANHLYLAHVALRRDLEDEKLIVACARHVGTAERLDMLYLLTLADALATGATAWSDWKAALLLELYLRVTHLLDHGDLLGDTRVDQASAANWAREQAAGLAKVDPNDLDMMPEDYLLHYRPDEIALHLDYREKLREKELILLPERNKAFWSVLVVTTDRHGLLAKICGVLALHNLRVLQAQLFTWDDGTVVDMLHVLPTINLPYEEQDWDRLREDLMRAIRHRLGLDYRLSRRLSLLEDRGRQPRSQRRVDIHIDNEVSDKYTVIEIYSDDRPGLLYDIAKTLSDLGMNICRAKIGSQADRVVDVFYVRDEEGDKLRDREYEEEVRRSLLFAAAEKRVQ